MQTILKNQIAVFKEEIKTTIKSILNILGKNRVFGINKLEEIENHLTFISYKASVLSLPEISELVNPSSFYVRELKTSGGKVTLESLAFIKLVLKKLHSYMKSIQLPDDDGVYIDGSTVLVNSFLHNPPSPEEIFSAYRKRQINISKINKFKKLSFKKDSDFAYAINIPASIVRENRGNYYISLLYTDASDYKNMEDFIDILKRIDDSGYSIIHGPLSVPLKSALEKENALHYYILLKTPQEPEKFLKTSNLKGKLIRTLHRPEDFKEEKAARAVSAENTEASKKSALTAGPEGFAKSAESEKQTKFTSDQYRNAMKTGDIRFSIGFKMISIISMVIIMALSGMIFLATWFFLQDSRIRVEENNLKVSEIVSMKIEEDIGSFGNAASLLMLGANQAEEENEDFIRYFFRNEPGVIFAGVPEIGANFYNKDILLDYNIDENFINNIISENAEEVGQAKQGITSVINVSPYLGVPVMALSIPYRQGRDLLSMVMLIDVRKSFMKLIETKGITLTYIVNEKGEIIAHPEESFIINAENLSSLKVVKDMLASPVSSGQIRFSDDKNKTYLGSYRKIPTGRLGIITQVDENVAFEAVYNIQRRNIYLMIMVLSITVLIVYFFSKTLTSPVKNLVVATKMIEAGDFRINLKSKTKDEIGVLTNAFVEMGKGLEEKERMKDAFGRFVNQEIAELAMKGEIQLGGEIKPATIFFSDIRSFTAISEKLTPSEVVEFLNEYMTLMVNCVNDTHGVVDKYIGDAIMAVWGTPISHGNDAENAINGALKMRSSLMRFNLDRGSDKKPVIRIGCGINSGDVLVGQIGSNERMEYTVIGDPVNLASRIEGLNKPMGTDILISENAANAVKGIFHLVPMNKIRVKGKSEPQQIYAVLGRLDDDSRPANLKELRRRVGITGNFDTIADVEEKEEVKYEIIR